MESIQEFVLELIEKDSRLPEGADIESFNYVDTGYIDSIGVIQFVVDIESRFEIEISDTDLESAEFRTVGGIVSIINRKVDSANQRRATNA